MKPYKFKIMSGTFQLIVGNAKLYCWVYDGILNLWLGFVDYDVPDTVITTADMFQWIYDQYPHSLHAVVFYNGNISPDEATGIYCPSNNQSIRFTFEGNTFNINIADSDFVRAKLPTTKLRVPNAKIDYKYTELVVPNAVIQYNTGMQLATPTGFVDYKYNQLNTPSNAHIEYKGVELLAPTGTINYKTSQLARPVGRIDHSQQIVEMQVYAFTAITYDGIAVTISGSMRVPNGLRGTHPLDQLVLPNGVTYSGSITVTKRQDGSIYGVYQRAQDNGTYISLNDIRFLNHADNTGYTITFS